MRLYHLLFIVLLLSSCTEGIKEDEHFLQNLMQTEPAKFQSILNLQDSLEVQIIYTQINRDANNRPVFTSFYFNVDSTHYFYPASTVKLPLVLLAFEKLNTLGIKGLTKYTPVFQDSVYAGQRSVRKDTTSESGLPSIAHYAKKILVVSDNDAANALYEFMGQRPIHDRLRSMGYNMRILHRLNRLLPPDQNRHTEAIRFLNHDTLIYSQPMLVNKDSIRPMRRAFKGTRHTVNDRVVPGPFDFTYKNFYPLQEQQEILKALLFPEAVVPARRFNLSEDDQLFIMKYMSQLPAETAFPPYQKDTTLFDAYCKFLMFGDDRVPIQKNIRIFNKPGDAYGFLIDNAYVVDFDSRVEFMLSAVISTNRDGNYNDDRYEYKTIGFPFMKNLGQLIYHYELKRKKERLPDLQKFKLTYDH